MKRLRKHYGCPVEFAVEFVSGKWKTVILAMLKERPHRYGELRARMPGLSDKVLTERLGDLRDLGLIDRSPADDGTNLFYRLTDRGESLRPVLDALFAWGDANASNWSVAIDWRCALAEEKVAA